MTQLSLHNISKSFGTHKAVDDLNLVIGQGRFVTLLGPSGCGKTTTLNMIAGFITPDQGEIRIDGRPIEKLPPRNRNMGMVFQNYALFPHLTVLENVGFGLEARHVPSSERLPRARKMLDLVGLAHMEDRLPKQLSGGQQQRVALARALVINPDILLLDEPFSNLDAKLRQSMRDEVRALQKRIDISAIFVTHDQDEAMAVSDEILVMNSGSVEQQAAPQHLYCYPATEFVARFLGDTNVLSGKIDAITGNNLARISFGSETGVAAFGSDAPGVGETVSVCVRPERVRLALPGSTDIGADEGLHGTVGEAVYLGARWRYMVDTTAGQVVISQEASHLPAISAGTRVALKWTPDEAWIIRASGKNE